DGQRLVEDVAQQRLQTGEAVAAGAAGVPLDGAAGIVEVVQDDGQVAGQLRGGLGERVEVLDRRGGGRHRRLAGDRGLSQGPDGRAGRLRACRQGWAAV